jgi:hypothetical protein
MRTTLYADAPQGRRRAALAAAALVPVENASARKRQRDKTIIPVIVENLVPEPVRLVQDTGPYEQVVLMAACN